MIIQKRIDQVNDSLIQLVFQLASLPTPLFQKGSASFILNEILSQLGQT